MRRLSVDYSAISLVFIASIVDATSFPARLPQTTVFWADTTTAITASDDGTDEMESSSDDDDWSDWLTGTESTVKKTTLPMNATATNLAAASPKAAVADTHEKVRTSSEPESKEPTSSHQQDVDYQSQPLKTLEKLQQMLDDTDYMTGAKSNRKVIATSNLPKNSDSGQAQDNNPTSKSQQLNNDRVVASKISPAASEQTVQRIEPVPVVAPPEQTDQLWQSKDRARYKRQQLKLRKSLAAQTQASFNQQSVAPPRPVLQPELPPLQQHVASSDDELSDDTDDGLGYSLPNLPVYFSDEEVDSEEQEPEQMNQAQGTQGAPSPSGTMTGYQPPPPVQESQAPPLPRQYHYPHHTQTQAPGYHSPLYGSHQPQHHYSWPPPPPGYPQHPIPHDAYRQQFAQQQLPPHYQAYPYPPGYPYPYPQFAPHSLVQHAGHPAVTKPYAQAPGLHNAPAFEQPPRVENHASADTRSSDIVQQIDTAEQLAVTEQVDEAKMQIVPGAQPMVPPPSFAAIYPQYPVDFSVGFYSTERSQSLAEASAQLSFDAIFKLSLLMVTVAVACYSGVSPRTLPLSEYNMQFYENLRLVSLSTIAPIVTVLSVFDARENDVNTWINTFFVSFTFGYALTFAAEIAVTTLVRLGVFCWLEPNVFSFVPKIPLPVLPWVLKDVGYRPKRITLFAADATASCIVAPVIEEYVKLKLLEWTTSLPRNFNWTVRESKKSKTKRKHAEALVRGPGEKDVVNANKFVSQMLAVSFGLKLCDTGRRILMYTKANHDNKSFYALCRGIFPIHELTGTMTALALAKRDLLGVEYKTWQILAPAVVIHAMANFRGMKPFFKWNAAMPWSEMQLSPVNVADPSTLFQLLKKGYAKMMWLIILGRVLGYCIKNYYMVNRQALKRTTTYAGKHAAFSAELATAEVLKKQKQKQN